MIIEISLWLLGECIDLSERHKWNVHFCLPDHHGMYADLRMKPLVRWYIWNTIGGEKNEC